MNYAEALAGLAEFESEEIDFELIFDLECGLPRNAEMLLTNPGLDFILRPEDKLVSGRILYVRVLSCSVYPCRPHLIQLDRCKSVMDGLDARHVHILIPLMHTLQHGLRTEIHELRHEIHPSS